MINIQLFSFRFLFILFEVSSIINLNVVYKRSLIFSLLERFYIIITDFIIFLKSTDPSLMKKRISIKHLDLLLLVEIRYFYLVSVNVSHYFFCFITKNRRYYLNSAFKLLKINLMNLSLLELSFLVLLPYLYVINNLFFVSSVRLPIMLLLVYF